MKQKIKILLDTSRPISWVNTAYPFAVGYLFSGGTFDTTFLVATLFFLIPYNLALYGVNDVYDYESDMNNPRKGGVEGAVTAKKFHPLILWSSLLLSLPFVLYLVVNGSMESNLTLAVVLFFVLAYSVKGLRFKERPVLDSITSSLHFTGPLLFALSIFGFPPQFMPYVAAFFFWGMASHAFGAVQDIIPDRKANIDSIATKFGARATTRFAALLYGLCSVILLSQGGNNILVGLTALLYVVNTVPYWSVDDKTSADTNKAWRRFLLINYLAGAVVTILLILAW